MLKRLLFPAMLAAMMFAIPAFAGSPPTSTVPITTLDIGLKLDTGRHYAMKLVDDHCGRVASKATAVEDNIKICAHDEGTQVRLDVDWLTRDAGKEVQNASIAFVAHGASFELDGGITKLTVSLK